MDAKELLTEGMSPVEAIQKNQVYALPSKIRKDRPVGAEEIRLPAGSLVRYLLDNSDYQGSMSALLYRSWMIFRIITEVKLVCHIYESIIVELLLYKTSSVLRPIDNTLRMVYASKPTEDTGDSYES
ncbi:hypothetical protein GLOIN_2v1848364 [Rhizophagus irregularis DAOM 181602=DAOM 197198]|nr:hypothetical protein GLOIN_2v1848364 [Rhizophagus irregularis DAOM 181602=DAOM 197198]